MPKMHPDELEIDLPLVRSLLAAQFPSLAKQPLAPVLSGGTDNAIFRLGDSMAIRLPRIHWAAGQAEKEREYLPRLAPHLPLAIPAPLAKGEPTKDYPYTWAIHRWLQGENATLERLSNPNQAAKTVAQFLTALHNIDATGAPAPGEHNSGRGVPLITRDQKTRVAIAELGDAIDARAATEAWEAALSAPAWNAPPVWIHGDIQSGNLLAVNGEISAVIDFGCLGAGDPACDLIVAWNLFAAESRKAFRAALQPDDATWARGRGWALSVALIALPYYQHTNLVTANIARHSLREVLSDTI